MTPTEEEIQESVLFPGLGIDEEDVGFVLLLVSPINSLLKL